MNWITDCWDRYNRPMSSMERIKLSPFEKWSQYRRPPFKLAFHLILVILTTVHVVHLSQTIMPYMRNNLQTWNDLLAPPDAVTANNMGATQQYLIYTVEQLQASLLQGLSVYYTTLNSTVDFFDYFTSSSMDGSFEPPVLTISTYKIGASIFDLSQPFDDSILQKQYFLMNVTDLGPFDLLMTDDSSKKILTHSIHSLSFAFRIKNFALYSQTRICNEWDIELNYDFTARSRIALTINPIMKPCPSSESNVDEMNAFTRQFSFWLAICSLSLAIMLQFTLIRSIFNSCRIFQKLRRRQARNAAHLHSSSSSSSSSLPFSSSNDHALDAADDHHDSAAQVLIDFNELSCSDRLKFFNIWFFITSLGNISIIVGSASYLFSSSNGHVASASTSVDFFFVGFGCMMLWVSTIQYFETFQAYYSLILTLKTSTPRLLKFFIGVVPVFMGYALFGVAYFSDTSSNFADVDNAGVTLFAVLNGDVIHDNFAEIAPKNLWISRLYLYSFISLFIYAVLNMFIAIVEDSFQSSQAFALIVNSSPASLSASTSSIMSTPSSNASTIPQLQPKLEKPASQIQVLLSNASASLFISEPLQPSASAKLQPLSSSSDSPILKKLNEIQISWIKHMQASFEKFNDQVAADLAQNSRTYRPSHSDDHYPCGFADCLHCSIRKMLSAAHSSIDRSLAEKRHVPSSTNSA